MGGTIDLRRGNCSIMTRLFNRLLITKEAHISEGIIRLHVVFISIGSLYSLSFFVFDKFFLGTMGLITVLFLFFAYLFKVTKRDVLSNIVFLLTANSAVLFFSFTLGKDSGIDTFFFSLSVIPFVIFLHVLP